MASYTVGTVRTPHQRPLLHCSFCGAPESKVEWLIAAHRFSEGEKAHICEECVEAAQSTLKEARRIERAQGRYR